VAFDLLQRLEVLTLNLPPVMEQLAVNREKGPGQPVEVQAGAGEKSPAGSSGTPADAAVKITTSS
jgi:hypothetical protein